MSTEKRAKGGMHIYGKWAPRSRFTEKYGGKPEEIKNTTYSGKIVGTRKKKTREISGEW